MVLRETEARLGAVRKALRRTYKEAHYAIGGIVTAEPCDPLEQALVEVYARLPEDVLECQRSARFGHSTPF